MQTYQSYSSPGTHCEERMIDIDEMVSLRVISFHPPNCKSNPTIVMVVGLASQIESFGNFLVELTKDHTTNDRTHSEEMALMIRAYIHRKTSMLN